MSTSTLSEIVEAWGGLIQTGPFGSQLHQHDYSEQGIPVVMPKDIRNGRVDESEIARIPEGKARNLSRHFLKAGSVVFPRRGEISKCAYINEEQAGFLCGTGCIKIEPPEEKLRSKFLFYFLGLRQSVEWLERNAVGTTMLNLNTKILGGLKIPLLAPKKQDEIVDTLSAYDDMIENNRRRIQLLEQAARLLYKEWFVRLRFPGHEHTQIIDGVPEGWGAGTIGDLGEVITGKTPNKKRPENFGSDLPFIKTPDMHGNAIVVHAEESLSEEGAKTQANKTIPPRSILVSCIGTVGAVAFNASPAQTNQQINSIVPASDLVTYWAYFMAKELKPLLEGMGGGATMANVNKSKFSGIKVVIPSKQLLNLFSVFTKPVFDQIENLTISNARLTKARDLLLPKLMNGEVAV